MLSSRYFFDRQRIGGNLAEKHYREFSLAKSTFVLIAAYLAVRFAASFMPESRLWGLNHSAFVDGLPFFFPAIFVIAILILYITSVRPDWLGNFDYKMPPGPFHKDIFAYATFILAAVSFILIAVDSHYLGDGYTLLANLSGADPTIKGRAYGEMQLQLLYHKLIGSDDAWNAYRAFRDLAILAGLIFLFALLYYGRKLYAARFSYVAFVLLNLFAAGTILFYGYVETYSVTSAMIYLSLISALAAFKNDRFSPIPLIALPLAIFLHLISVVYLPALLLYLAYFVGKKNFRQKFRNKGRFLVAGTALMFTIFYLLVKVAGPPFWQRAFLPPVVDKFTADHYTLFSLSHLSDYLNLVMMLAPVAILLPIIRRLHRNKSSSNLSSPDAVFISVAAVSGLMAAFMIEPKLGMARDWDLMSTMVIALQVAGTYFWITFFESRPQFAVATVFMILLSLAAFIPWLTLHNSGRGLYRYTLAVSQLDPKHGRTAFFIMKSMMETQGDAVETERLSLLISRLLPEQALDKEGAALFNRGEYERALTTFDRAIKENPSWYGPYFDKGICLSKLNRWDDALEMFEIADALNPYNPDLYFQIGNVYKGKKNYDQMRRYWQKALRYDRGNWKALLGYGTYHLDMRQYDSALYYLTLQPDSAYEPELFYFRGVAWVKKKDTARAVRDFRRYLETGKDPAVRQDIMRFLKETGPTD